MARTASPLPTPPPPLRCPHSSSELSRGPPIARPARRTSNTTQGGGFAGSLPESIRCRAPRVVLSFDRSAPWLRPMHPRHPRPLQALNAAEFFAGIGLVRAALEAEGVRVAYANDYDRRKTAMYAANFSDGDLDCRDVRTVRGSDIPTVDIATSSFPCTDLSLAGNRAGLRGTSSGMFWEFARILNEMKGRAPRAVLLENVIGFATSNGGLDLLAAIERLNDLGYICDVFIVDARWFVPQSRPRLFIVGSSSPAVAGKESTESVLRPAWLNHILERRPRLRTQAVPIRPPEHRSSSLTDIVEAFEPDDDRWWSVSSVDAFLASLSQLQAQRMESLRTSLWISHAASYRRTRRGKAVWEIRSDALSGCLRTTRGGSSKQALVEAGKSRVRVRWMTGREYARLQGASKFIIDGFTENQIRFAMGDAVCVPVVQWIAKSYLIPLTSGSLKLTGAMRKGVAHG